MRNANRSAMARAEPARVRFVYVDCSIERGGKTLEWCHLVAEGNVADTVRIVKHHRPGAKVKVRR